MGLKILHSADWHMGSPFASVSREQQDFLRHQQRMLPGKIAELCRRENCDLVLLAGDIFDGVPSRDIVNCVKQGLAECGVPVFVSPGNHDFCAPGSPWLEENWPENVFVFRGDLESVVLPERNCRIFGAGYRGMDCPGLLTDFHAAGSEQYKIGLFHGDPVTSQSPYCPITAGQIRESGLQYLALGHIHKAGTVKQGDTFCGWPGCPMGRGWDETGKKGVYLVSLGSTVSVEFHDLGMPCFYDREVEIAGDAVAALESVLPAASRDFFRITLTGSAEVSEQALYSHFTELPNLVLRNRTEMPVDVWEVADTDSLRGVYFRMLRELAKTDESALLAAEISHRILSGREVTLP